MRVRLGLVSEVRPGFLNQVKLCLFSLRKNAGALSDIPVTLITNSEPLSDEEKTFFTDNFSPIEFATSPRLGAIPHTSKLNVFYSIDPSTYDVLLFMDCDTVIFRPLDEMLNYIQQGAQFVCRRGGETDRNRFVNFNQLTNRFCGSGEKKKVTYDGVEEWPMFNSGVFLALPEAVRKIRKDAVEFTYQLFNEWQRTNTLISLPPSVKRAIKLLYKPNYPFRQNVTQNWPIEQGALALSCIKSGVVVNYLDEKYNNWGNDEYLHILHCFKSLYRFDRRSMFSNESDTWLEEYQNSEVPGQRYLSQIVREYKSLHPVKDSN